MRISDCSSDVCSSDLCRSLQGSAGQDFQRQRPRDRVCVDQADLDQVAETVDPAVEPAGQAVPGVVVIVVVVGQRADRDQPVGTGPRQRHEHAQTRDAAAPTGELAGASAGQMWAQKNGKAERTERGCTCGSQPVAARFYNKKEKKK